MIIDASVALKWFLPEPDAALAGRVFLQGNLTAPSIFPIEIGHVLTKYVRQRIIAASDAMELWFDLQRTEVRIVDSNPLLTPAMQLSLRLGAGLYDCIYLCLAVREDDIFVTADDRFVRAADSEPDLRGRAKRLGDAVL